MESSVRIFPRISPKTRRNGRRRKPRLRTITMKIRRSYWTMFPRSPPGSCSKSLICATSMCLMFIVLIAILVSARLDKRTGRMAERMDKWGGRYEIEMPGCRLPVIDPHDKVIRADWFAEDSTTCEPQKRYFLSTEIRGNETCLEIHEDILMLDYGVLPDRIKCSYKVIEARFDQDPWMNLYSYTGAKELELDKCFDEPYIWVQCALGEEKYVQPLFIAKDVPPKTKYTSVNAQSPPIPRERNLIPKKKLNVLVLGVDAVSRTMFHRLMPSTYKIMKRLYGKNMVELKLFNKVGANSAPNQIPMLTGKRFRHDEHMNSGEYFETFGPFVWEDFSEVGYTTLFVEEQMRYGLFTYPNRQGFRDIPTDHWPRPLSIALDEYRRKQQVWSGCLGDEYISTTTLKYWIQLQQVSTSPTFSYVWLSEATHDSLTGAKTADLITSQFFEDLERSGSIEDTIIFLLADHGYRFAPFRETPLGTLEDMLPFAFILLPRSYRTANPEDLKRLEENGDRLTTPYDIHATLKDLAARSRGQRVEFTQLGKSLLSSRISPERTCDSANIEPPYCSCYVRTAMDPSAYPFTDEMAKEVMATINEVLKQSDTHRQCLVFTSARLEQLDAMGLDANVSDSGIFSMKVKVDPDPVTFEASIKIVNGTASLIGLPERLDRYDINSYCVRETFYEKFCHCKVPPSTS